MKANMMMWNKTLWLFALLIAGTYTVNAATIYSASGGTWSDPPTWVGGVVPTAADDVIIESGHLITITSNETVNSLRLNSLMFDLNVLTINSGVTLTVNDGVLLFADVDASFSRITCNGTLTVGGDITFDAADAYTQAVLLMGANSHLNLAGNIVPGTNGGRLASSGFFTCTFNGGSAQNMYINGTRFVYKRVIFDNTAGVTLMGNITATNTLGSVVVNSGTLFDGGYTITGANADSTFTIRSGASLDLTGTNGLPATYKMVIESNSSIIYHGSGQTINAPNNSQTYANLQINSAGTATLGSNITVGGNLALVAGTLDVSSGNNYNIDVAGNWLNTGVTFMKRAGTVTFNGTAAQAITSNASDFYNLTFNNASVAGITLNDDVAVTNSITFTDGVVTTGSNLLTINNTSASSISGYGGASFVNGRLRRYMATNTSIYAFPVGNGVNSSSYKLAELVNGNLSGTSYITASFGSLTNHNDIDMSATDVHMTYLSVAPDGVWTLTPNAQPSGGTYDIRLYIGNFSSQLTDNQFGPLKRNEGSLTAADWSAVGDMNNPNLPGRVLAFGYTLRMNLTSFSEFGVGRASKNGNPLPIELLYFSAEPEDGAVNLNWATAVEIENEYFTVERSTDGVNFKEVTRLEGAGNSSMMLTYATVDTDPADGVNYYRLKQTDFDGTESVSNIVAVQMEGTEPEVEVSIFPNPAQVNNNVVVRLNRTTTEPMYLEMVEIGSGKLVYQNEISSVVNNIELPSGMATGLYLMRLTGNGQVINQKLLVQ